MPDRMPVCQPYPAHPGVSSPKSTPNVGHGLPLAAADQWATTTPARHATDSYSWLQAVHWVHGAGLHQPTHGPRFTDTTLRIARLCADLTPCRPSVAYLMRITRLSERTVQYHLGILRDMGLLAYVIKGTRRRGATPLASEFVRTIPPCFDTALGIRTVGEGATRRAVGIAEHGRKTIAKLAKLATRKVPKRRTKTPSKPQPRCTPMGGGTSTSSSTGSTHSPSESKLASGEADCLTPKEPNRGPRKLNEVGRRYQLARELIQQVPWLARASTARIAWIVSEVADAGWTCAEVIAWLDNGQPPTSVRRPSGFLGQRLKGATSVCDTPAKRQNLLESARDSRRATQARHAEWEYGEQQGPRSPAVQRLVAEAFAPKAAAPLEDGHLAGAAGDPFGIEDLSREVVIDMRAAAQKDPSMIRGIFDGLGERTARRLYTNDLVDRFLKGDAAHLTAHARLH